MELLQAANRSYDSRTSSSHRDDYLRLCLCIPRLVSQKYLSISDCLFLCFGSLFALGTTVTDTVYLTGARKWLVQRVTGLECSLLVTIMGVVINKQTLSPSEIDYSHYLGPDY